MIINNINSIIRLTSLPVLNSNISPCWTLNNVRNNVRTKRYSTLFRKNAVFAKYLNSNISPCWTLNNVRTKRYLNSKVANSKHWINLEYKLTNPSTINKNILEFYLNKFWEEVMKKLNMNQHVYLITRIKLDNDQIATISTLKKINTSTTLDDLLTYLLSRLSLSSESYNVNPIVSIIFSYGIREGKINPDLVIGNKETKYQTYYNNKLPIAMLPEEYGNILRKMDNHYIISVSKDVMIILDTQIKNTYVSQGDIKINNIQYIKNGQILFTWIDRIIDDNSFIREIGKSIYHYENKELVLMKVIKKSNPISETKISKEVDHRFITMDLETILINGVHVPYLLCWSDGQISKSYFIENTNFNLENNILTMVNKAMSDICIRKYRNYRVYLHNFSKFDGYFLVKYLSQLGMVDPILHKGRIISVNFMKKDTKYNIIFKDSYLMLPSSLKKLCKSFNVSDSLTKGTFPVKFYDLNYEGVVPDFRYFSNISLEEYNSYRNSFISENKIWNFKQEAEKYCKLDCISLFQILSKFNQLVFNKFSLNFNNYPTLPSLSFAIFRTHYYEVDDKNSVHMISGKISENIRMGYTGGAVDMYIPKPKNNSLPLYGYDVNSLYAFIMSKFKMPVGNPTYFEGDIFKKENKPFGFFFCKIIAPNKLKYPIIQTHIKTKDGVRTVAPLGTWSDMLFSEEIYNAMKYGYKFEVKWGYTFDSSFVFTEFINDLYKIRLDYPKTDPMNMVAKLVMNSLYGRFGMDDDFVFSYIMTYLDYEKFELLAKDSIMDVIDLDGKNYLVQANKSPLSDLNTTLDNGNEKHNVNIAIAAAISGYARIHMSQFKNSKDYNLYYSDTDSIYIDKPLNEEFISETELGKLKLENIVNNGVFLAPKVYGIVNDKGSEIIKVKGLTKESIGNISIDTLEELLVKDSKKEFDQDKWYRSIKEGNISVKEQIYTLRVTGNKRKLIYDNDKLVGTVPFIINEDKTIINE